VLFLLTAGCSPSGHPPGTSWATALRPPLTVLTQPTYEIGQTAADLLLRRVRGEDFPPRRVVLQAQLVERASSQRTRAHA
jgi:LacI family transcriptional regulator